MVAEHGAKLKNVCPWCYLSPESKFHFGGLKDELENATHRMQCLKKLINHKQGVIKFCKKLQCRYCNESRLPRNMQEHVQTCHIDTKQCIFCGDDDACDWSCVGVRVNQKYSLELKKKYQGKCKNLTMLVECRECEEKILPMKYGYHMKLAHSHDEFKCIWCTVCDETIEIDYVHRLECMMKWYENHREMKNHEEILLADRNVFANVSKNPSDGRSSKLFLNCKECNDWYHDGPDASLPYSDELPDGFTDPINNTEGVVDKIMNSLKSHDDIMVSNEIEFIPESGLDARWIALYLSGKYKFYHLMIRQQVKFLNLVYPRVFNEYFLF